MSPRGTNRVTLLRAPRATRPLTITLVASALLGLVAATPVTAAEDGPAPSAPPSVEARVEHLEQGMEDLHREIAELRALLGELVAQGKQAPGEPAAAASDQVPEQTPGAAQALTEATDRIESEQQRLADQVRETAGRVDLLSAAERRRNNLTVYGTVNAIRERSPEPGTLFDAEAFELVVSGQPHDRLGFFAEIELERAATVGGERGGEVLLEQAYANYTLTPWLSLRGGALLVPFGNVNVDHYAPNRAVISKPLTSYVVAPSDWTDNGFGIYGNAPVGDLSSFDYELYLVSGLDADVTALGTRDARQPFGADNNTEPALVGRGAWSLGGWLRAGVSVYTGAYDDAGDLALTGGALDLYMERGPLLLTGEVNRLVAEQARFADDADLRGWYGRLVYRWQPGLLASGWHGQAFPTARIELVAEYDEARLEGPLDGAWSVQREHRWTGGVNYRPTYNWVLKLDYERSDARDLALQFGTRRAWLASIGFQF